MGPPNTVCPLATTSLNTALLPGVRFKLNDPSQVSETLSTRVKSFPYFFIVQAEYSIVYSDYMLTLKIKSCPRFYEAIIPLIAGHVLGRLIFATVPWVNSVDIANDRVKYNYTPETSARFFRGWLPYYPQTFIMGTHLKY